MRYQFVLAVAKVDAWHLISTIDAYNVALLRSTVNIQTTRTLVESFEKIVLAPIFGWSEAKLLRAAANVHGDAIVRAAALEFHTYI